MIISNILKKGIQAGRALVGAVHKHKIVALVILVVVGGSFYFGYSKNKNNGEEVRIKTATVEKGDIVVSVSGIGNVFAKNQVDLKPATRDEEILILDIKFESGQTVKKGDVVVVLDAANVLADVRNAAISLEEAQMKLKQVKIDNNNKTKEESLARGVQELAIAKAQNNLSSVRQDLQDYYLRAPFDGIITDIRFESGDSVSRGEVIASVITEELMAKASFNEVDAAAISIGNMATLTFDALDNVLAQGRINSIDTIGTIDQGVVSYEAGITLDFQPENLKPGMSVDTEIITAQKNDVVIVPKTAVKKGRDGTSFVLLVSEERVEHNNNNNREQRQGNRRVVVETGISNETHVEITNGLSAGEKIITGEIDSARGEQFSEQNENRRSLFPTGRPRSGGRGFGALH